MSIYITQIGFVLGFVFLVGYKATKDGKEDMEVQGSECDQGV